VDLNQQTFVHAYCNVKPLCLDGWLSADR